MAETEIQDAMREFCRVLRAMSQQPSLRTHDPANQAYLRALHMAMDHFKLDDKFTIGAAEE